MSVMGIDGFGVWSAYILSVLSAVFCVIYGIINWDRGDDKVFSEDVTWVKDEKEFEGKI